tara:strand:- start:300 stop:692 length:393 start_codon:yes stop_codon:yes gene_type:complete
LILLTVYGDRDFIGTPRESEFNHSLFARIERMTFDSSLNLLCNEGSIQSTYLEVITGQFPPPSRRKIPTVLIVRKCKKQGFLHLFLLCDKVPSVAPGYGALPTKLSKIRRETVLPFQFIDYYLESTIVSA